MPSSECVVSVMRYQRQSLHYALRQRDFCDTEPFVLLYALLKRWSEGQVAPYKMTMIIFQMTKIVFWKLIFPPPTLSINVNCWIKIWGKVICFQLYALSASTDARSLFFSVVSVWHLVYRNVESSFCDSWTSKGFRLLFQLYSEGGCRASLCSFPALQRGCSSLAVVIKVDPGTGGLILLLHLCKFGATPLWSMELLSILH